MVTGRCAVGGILLSLAAAFPAAAGQTAQRPMTDLIPAECLVVYIARPQTTLSATSRPGADTGKAAIGSSTIATILGFLSASGLIPEEGQVFADIATALPLLGRFDHAMALLDVSSRVVRRPTAGDEGPPARTSLRLKELQTAVLFRTNGQHRVVLEQLNRVIGRYTNAGVARLSLEELAGLSYQRLSDERLPGWAVWEWGRLGDFFVVSFGAGAFEKIAKTYAGKMPSLSDDAWFKSATVKTQSDRAMAQWFVALSRLEQRLANVARGRLARVIAALDADGMTHDLWTIGLEDRALTLYRCYRRDGRDITRRYSDPARYPRRHVRIVPEKAGRFAVIRVPTPWLVDNLPRAWMAAQSERHVHTWTRVWRRLEHETGIDINGNLIEHLGQNVVIFDYPPHPLRIPIALTIAIEIDDSQAVQAAIDALLGAWGRYLDERARRKGTTLVRVKVHREDDKVWYLQAGIPGPALKVTDRYLVISWSPQALRDALPYIELDDGDKGP